MPKRMRDQVLRDREAALALARLREQAAPDDELLTLAEGDVEIDVDDLDPAAFVRESSDLRRNVLTAAGAHRVDEADADFDVDAFFASVIQDDDAPSRDSLARPATGDAAARGGRSQRPSSRPPAVSRTATGHPRPGSTSTGPATRKLTGPLKVVRPPSNPGPEPLAGGAPARTAEPRVPSHVEDEPVVRLSIPPIGSASPAAATRRITGPMRTVRPPTNPDPEPASAAPDGAAPGGEAAPGGAAPGGAAPGRATGQTAAARPPSEAPPAARPLIPSIGSANPGAATRRIVPPSRAARPPSSPDPEPASEAPPGRATGQGRAVTAPTTGDAGAASSAPAGRATGQGRAVTAPASGNAGAARSWRALRAGRRR